jgi:hypothetical protein
MSDCTLNCTVDGKPVGSCYVCVKSAKPKTQKERVLEILKDGFWHTSLEFCQLARPILKASTRISELRRDGHKILCEVRGNYYKYKLEA